MDALLRRLNSIHKPCAQQSCIFSSLGTSAGMQACTPALAGPASNAEVNTDLSRRGSPAAMYTLVISLATHTSSQRLLVGRIHLPAAAVAAATKAWHDMGTGRPGEPAWPAAAGSSGDGRIRSAIAAGPTAAGATAGGATAAGATGAGATAADGPTAAGAIAAGATAAGESQGGEKLCALALPLLE